MEKFGNGMKAVCIVIGGLALIGLLCLLWPILSAVGYAAAVGLGILVPIVLIAVAIVLVYKKLQDEDSV